MKFFLTVTTYSTTTRLGKELAAFVGKKFDRMLTDSDGLSDIIAQIKAFISKFMDLNPRVKPMAVKSYGFTPGSRYSRIATSSPCADVWCESPNGGNRPFTIHIFPVISEYCLEGGAK